MAADKRFMVDSITVTGSDGEESISYDFMPDQVVVVSEETIEDVVDVRLIGAQGDGLLPLYAQGPLVVPGISENQRIVFINRDLGDHVLRVTAQKGYLPTSIAVPTNLARPDSVAILGQTYSAATGNPTTFNHQNPVEGNVYVFVRHQKSGGTEPPISVSSMTVGGIAAGLKVAQNQGAAGRRIDIWEARAVPAGTVAVVINYTGTPANTDSWAMTFDIATSSGNTGGRAGVGNVVITNVEKKSSAYMFSYASAESGGAEVVFDNQGSATAHDMYRRPGAGDQTFIMGAGGMCAAVEVRLA